MKIENWPVERPVPYARNARKISEAAIAKVATSLKEFGWRQPVVVDDEGVVIAGHTRLLAAQRLGLTKVPVHVAEGLTPEQVRAYRLMDNRSHEETEWDYELLGEELFDLKGLDLDLGLTGFDSSELAELLAHSVDGKGGEDVVPETPAEPVSRPGDLWQLGDHRVLCGDATQDESVMRLMDGQKADLVVTDPPYNIDYTGKTKDALKIQNDKKSDADFYGFLLNAYRCMFSAMNDGASIYVFHADTEGLNFRRAFVDAGLYLAACCVWAKQTMVFGRSDYQWQHEPVLYGWKPTAAHRWYSDRKQTTLWHFDRPSQSQEHPTMKPVALVSYPIVNSSKGGDVVLDPFGGSGTTLIACEKEGRLCRTSEIDPAYCDVIVRRWQTFTGKLAMLGTQTFDEVAASREVAPSTSSTSGDVEKPEPKRSKGGISAASSEPTAAYA
jgi:DNA modification methylase